MAYSYKKLVGDLIRRDASDWVQELLRDAGYKTDLCSGIITYRPDEPELMPTKYGYNYKTKMQVQLPYDYKADNREQLPLGKTKTLIIEGAAVEYGFERHMITDAETHKLLWSESEDMRDLEGITKCDPWADHTPTPAGGYPDNGIRNEDFLDMNEPALF